MKKIGNEGWTDDSARMRTITDAEKKKRKHQEIAEEALS